jgi:putative transferase (TIGR04331 family)
LLFVNYEISRFSGIHSIYSGFSYRTYLIDQFNFIKKLDSHIHDRLVFREYPHDLGWNIDLKSALKDNIKLEVLKDKNKKLYDSLSKSRICFVNLNSTVLLETLNLNFPTVLFLNTNNEPVNNEAKIYLNILKKAGIFFDDYEMAAKKINQIWDNVGGWWHNASTQHAVSIFCDKFSKRSLSNPVKDLYKVFKNFK